AAGDVDVDLGRVHGTTSRPLDQPLDFSDSCEGIVEAQELDVTGVAGRPARLPGWSFRGGRADHEASRHALRVRGEEGTVEDTGPSAERTDQQTTSRLGYRTQGLPPDPLDRDHVLTQALLPGEDDRPFEPVMGERVADTREVPPHLAGGTLCRIENLRRRFEAAFEGSQRVFDLLPLPVVEPVCYVLAGAPHLPEHQPFAHHAERDREVLAVEVAIDQPGLALQL